MHSQDAGIKYREVWGSAMLCQHPSLLPSLSCRDAAGESVCPEQPEEITDELKMNLLRAEERKLVREYAYGSTE